MDFRPLITPPGTPPPGRPFRRYVLLGVASMASAEFQANVLLRGTFIGWVLAMVVVYAGLSAIAWLIGQKVQSEHADLWFYAVGGLFGLVIIEWIFIGFYPGSGKPGIHAAMFTNWAAVFTIPRLFTTEPTQENLRLRREVKRTILQYSFAAPVLVLLLPINRGGCVALLMTAYSLFLSFQFEPFLGKSVPARKLLRRFNLFLVVVAVLNVIAW